MMQLREVSKSNEFILDIISRFSVQSSKSYFLIFLSYCHEAIFNIGQSRIDKKVALRFRLRNACSARPVCEVCKIERHDVTTNSASVPIK